MAEMGRAVLTAMGKRGLKANGKVALFLAGGTCPACCECEMAVLGSRVLAPYQTWDLTPYQGPDQASPGAYYRIYRVVPCPSVPTNFFGEGCVDGYGELKALRNSIQNYFTFTITVELQIGCFDGLVGLVHWPGTCHPWTERPLCT